MLNEVSTGLEAPQRAYRVYTRMNIDDGDDPKIQKWISNCKCEYVRYPRATHKKVQNDS